MKFILPIIALLLGLLASLEACGNPCNAIIRCHGGPSCAGPRPQPRPRPRPPPPPPRPHRRPTCSQCTEVHGTCNRNPCSHPPPCGGAYVSVNCNCGCKLKGKITFMQKVEKFGQRKMNI